MKGGELRCDRGGRGGERVPRNTERAGGGAVVALRATSALLCVLSTAPSSMLMDDLEDADDFPLGLSRCVAGRLERRLFGNPASRSVRRHPRLGSWSVCCRPCLRA